VLDSQLVKEFPEFNAKAYGGYRYSDGNFPEYEEDFLTQDGGEVKIGLIFSLLRDRIIDEDRFRLFNSQLELTATELELLLRKISVQHMAMQAYWEWLAAGHTMLIRQELYDIALKRQEGLITRAERGDVADILVTENKQTIINRKAKLIEARRTFANKSNSLSLYYRNEEGQPIIPDEEALPETFPTFVFEQHQQVMYEEMMEALIKRPEFALIDTAIEQEQNRLLMGENALLPQLDLGLEASENFGMGSRTLEDTETIVKMNISIPLQQRLGAGRIAKAKAEIRRLEFEKQMLDDKIRAELQNILTNIEAAAERVQLTEQEIDLALTMQQAERQRFLDGLSDFFVLNMRENRVADAKIKNILSLLKYHTSKANLYAATVDTEKLMVDLQNSTVP
jgi:outer membrane protein TolC